MWKVEFGITVDGLSGTAAVIAGKMGALAGNISMQDILGPSMRRLGTDDGSSSGVEQGNSA